ncbi:MAG: hypothetical protein ACJA1A_003867 [Saprospiraceae bacterium]|jgi:hypothetical protein
MKNLIYAFVLTVFSSSAFAQGIIEREYSQYLDQDDVTHVYVSGKMFDFASTIANGIDDAEVKELSEFASKIESFSLIKVPNKDVAQKEYKKGMKSISGKYDELMRVRDDGTKFAIFVDEENDIVYEIVGLGVVDGEFMALSLVGEMDLNKIAEFVGKMDNDVFEPLKRIGEFKPNEVRVYPNPASANSEFTIEIPEGMVGGTITLYNANGNKVKTKNASVKSTKLKTGELSAGNYFIEIQKEGVTMKKQVIIIE